MIHWLCALAVAGLQDSGPYHFRVPLEALELAPDAALPESVPWNWGDNPWLLPRALLDGPGEALYVSGADAAEHWHLPLHQLGWLFVQSDRPGPVTGTLLVPEMDLSHYRRVPFTIAVEPTGDARDLEKGEWLRYRRFYQAHLPGSAWFYRRMQELAQLGQNSDASVEPPLPFPDPDWSADLEVVGLFSGGRAVAENLQLERVLPPSDPDPATVPVDGIEGITVRAFDWTSRLAKGDTALDPLAALVPADQHALFFPSFEALVAVLDESERLGAFGLAAFEERSADAHTRRRIERQLCLELDAVARALGPLVIESVVLTGSDPYLRTGSDVAVLLRCRDAKGLTGLRANLAARHEATGGVQDMGGADVLVAATSTRAVSSYVATLPGDDDGATVLLVTNSPVQLARIQEVARGAAAALSGSDEYRFFRQRYARGADGESAFLVLPDAAIRRWCSPRWRIGAARRARALAVLADAHAAHVPEILAGDVAERSLGRPARFPDLGELRLERDLVVSPSYGTLDFLTPIAELEIDKVTEREANLYARWRDGYQSNWANFFDPIAASVSVAGNRTAVDLTVMPLILESDYADLREAVRGPGLSATAGDPHAAALVHFTMQVNLDWEELGDESMVGVIGGQLGVEPLGWVGSWLTVYVDDAPLWNELLSAEDWGEASARLEGDLNRIPVAVEVAVASPMKLALFLSAARAFVDSSAPGLAVWKDRSKGDLRFVEVTSDSMADDFSLFYGTTPEALILSLNEDTLVAAMERHERRRSGAEPTPTAPWAGASVGLALDGAWARRILALAEDVEAGDVATMLRRTSYRNLPILEEWHRLFPDRDPVEVHERAFRERLECPGGGSYVWDETWQAMKSTVLGSPGAPESGVRWPPAWDELARASFALTLEDDGLRARVEIERR